MLFKEIITLPIPSIIWNLYADSAGKMQSYWILKYMARVGTVTDSIFLNPGP
jgi:hypothetical protein